MATLSYGDIVKRNNAEILVSRIVEGKMIRGVSEGPPIELKPVVKIGSSEIPVTAKNASNVAKAIFVHCEGSRTKNIELKHKNGSWLKLTAFYKDPEFAGKKPGAKVSKSDAERQERGLIQIIQQLTLSGPVNITGIPKPVTGARKIEGLSSIGQEPYTDIVIECVSTEYNVSCKGKSAPSLAGGGLKGLKLAVPQMMDDFFVAVHRDYMEMGYVEGEQFQANQIKDFYYEIPMSYNKKIMEGTAAMGGPIHLMYIGEMDVVYNNGFNGNFIPVVKYSSKKFYMRLRQRDSTGKMLTVDFTSKDGDGFPVVHRAGSRKTSRIVIQDKVPANGILRKL